MIPILVICKDRVRYLDTTLKSIFSTVSSSVPIFVYNDGTKNLSMIEYLTTSNAINIELIDEYPNWNSDWIKYVGFIKNTSLVTGIAGKINVIMSENCCGTSGIGFTCNSIFENEKSSYLVKVEGDMVFKKGWYESMCLAIKSDESIGLVSGFRYFFRSRGYGPVSINELNDRVDLVSSGYTGACVYSISKVLTKKAPQLFVNDIMTMTDYDDFWINGCRGSGMKFCVLKESCCQHIGVTTEITDLNHKQFMKNGKTVKVDFNSLPPFEIGQIKNLL
jgi:hypothetical protein